MTFPEQTGLVSEFVQVCLEYVMPQGSGPFSNSTDTLNQL